MDHVQNHWYWTTGQVIGTVGSIIAFFAIYAAAIGSVGWVIGIALGWVAASLGAAACYYLTRLLWLPALLLIALGLFLDLAASGH